MTSPDEFEADLRALLEDLRRRAAAGDSARKVAAGNVTGPGFETIFGMVQCSPDLSSQDCTSCLVSVISEIPICCDKKTGGRVLSPSCNLHFETYPFFNETRLRELEFVPPPQPPPPPPPPSPPPPPFPVVEPPTQSSPGNQDYSTHRLILLYSFGLRKTWSFSFGMHFMCRNVDLKIKFRSHLILI